ncbi:MAG: phosphotransferase family protein, partial [Polyangiaceae bacterium]|nr:phosphotransferase family protein [Polyangiaceae bacterium]
FLGRQVKRWYGQWERVATRELADLDALHRKLASTTPSESDATVVHGDYRLDNVLLATDDPGRVAAILDWEMAALGDPLTDVGLLTVYWDPACSAVLPEGHAPSSNAAFPSADDLIETYAKASGRDVSKLGFYRALGYFKLAIIAEGIHGRFLAGLTVGEGFETVGRAVPALVASGLEYVR